MLKTTLLFAMLATPCYACESNTAIAIINEAAPDPAVSYMDRAAYGNPHAQVIDGLAHNASRYNGPVKCVAGCDANDR